MRNIALLVALAFLASLPMAASADDHAPASNSAVELWVCKYKDGKSIEDLRAWYKDFNVLSDNMANGNFRSWLFTDNALAINNRCSF